jgi:hypothetical protein
LYSSAKLTFIRQPYSTVLLAFYFLLRSKWALQWAALVAVLVKVIV